MKKRDELPTPTPEEKPEEEDHIPQNLPAFDPKMLKVDTAMMAVGKRRYGKTIFVRWILSLIKDYFLEVYVFTTTKHNYFWQQHVPDSRVYDTIDWDVIDKVLERQKDKRDKRMKTGEAKLANVLFIFDDVISKRRDMRYEEKLLALFFNGRHYDLFFCICSQDVKGLPPDLRANSDIIALTWQSQERQIETANKDWADFFQKKSTFKKMLQANTRDHQMLIIDQAEAKYSPDDVFSIATADPDPPPFRLGDAVFWKESGCDWGKQLEYYHNLQKTDLTAEENQKLYEKVKKEAWNESRKIERQYDEVEQESIDLVTSAYTLLQGEDEERYFAQVRKKIGNNMEEVERDLQIIRNMYRPPDSLKSK